MNDALLVRRLQRFGNLLCDGKCFVYGDPSAHDSVGKRFPLDKLQDERADGRPCAVALLEPVNGTDVRMFERRQNLRFSFESREPFRICGKNLWKNFQCNVTGKSRIARTIDLAHTTSAQNASDLVRADARSVRQRHVAVSGFYRESKGGPKGPSLRLHH